MKKEISKAMQICARKVRKTPCESCLHFKRCLRNGCAPISNLGAYLAALDMNVLKALGKEIRQRNIAQVYLSAFAPNKSELDYFAVIRAHSPKRACLFSVGLHGNETADEIRELVIDRIIYGKEN